MHEKEDLRLIATNAKDLFPLGNTAFPIYHSIDRTSSNRVSPSKPEHSYLKRES
jgi:hypothetical protein